MQFNVIIQPQRKSFIKSLKARHCHGIHVSDKSMQTSVLYSIITIIIHLIKDFVKKSSIIVDKKTDL